jgi:hypothetical protein
MDSPTYAE